jgi:hypothetical protein
LAGHIHSTTSGGGGSVILGCGAFFGGQGLGLLGCYLEGGGFFAGGGCVLYGLVTLLAQGVRFALQGFGLCNGFGGEGQVV